MSQRKALQAFLVSLSVRKERMRRAAYLVSIEFGPVTEDKASVTATWDDKGEKKSLVHSWTFIELFGYVGTAKPRLKKGACRCSTELVRAVLKERGVVH